MNNVSVCFYASCLMSFHQTKTPKRLDKDGHKKKMRVQSKSFVLEQLRVSRQDKEIYH